MATPPLPTSTPHPLTPKRLRRLLVTLVILACMLGATNTEAATNTDDNLLEQRVRHFLTERTRDMGHQATIEVFPGRLKSCDDPRPFLPRPGQQLIGRITVGVHCGDQASRTRYLQAAISIPGERLVAARDIALGAEIRRADLKLVAARLERLPRHALQAFDQALGQMAARPLKAGTPLGARDVRRERLVHRGSKVTVVAQGDGFSIKRQAKALDNGVLGDSVRLRTAGGERLKATVIGQERLKVTF